MATATWTHSYGGFRITYSTSVASNNTITVNITKVEVSSTYYTGYIYPDCKIQINGTTVITMDCDTVATHRAYCSSTGTYYTVVNYNGNSGGSAATGSKSGIAVGTAITISCVGNSYSSGNSVYIYHDSYRWTISGTTTTVSAPTVYTVSYNANGGSSTPAAQKKVSGQNITVSSAISRNNSTANGYTVTFNGNGGTPSKTSATATNTIKYTFSKWNTSQNGSGTSYNAGATYSANANATLYAQWSSSTTRGAITTATASRGNGTATRTVTFNANGGSCSTASLNSTATITYTCKGWYTATSGGTKRASSGGSYTPSASETVYAQWTSTTGAYSAVTLPTPTRDGYNFLGWATSSTATSGTTGSYTPTGNVTLYAVWSQSTITITAYHHLGDNASIQFGYAVTTHNVISGNTFIPPVYTDLPEGFTTEGSTYQLWSPGHAGVVITGKRTGIDGFVVNGTYDTTIDVFYYYKTYAVNYDANGGTDAPSAQTKTHGTAITLSSVVPTKEDTTSSCTVTYNANGGYCPIVSSMSYGITTHTFNNWNTESDGSGINYEAGASYTENAALTLYAQYTSDTGEFDEIKLPTPIRSGYDFLGWAPSATDTSGSIEGYIPSGDIVLYAIWSKKANCEQIGFVYVGNKQHYVYIKIQKRYKKSVPYVYSDNKWKVCE